MRSAEAAKRDLDPHRDEEECAGEHVPPREEGDEKRGNSGDAECRAEDAMCGIRGCAEGAGGCEEELSGDGDDDQQGEQALERPHWISLRSRKWANR
jgi:hypothetical protein